MDDGNFTPNPAFGALPDSSMDFNFVDELLFDGCWLETTDALNFLQSGPSSSGPVNDPSLLPYSEGNTGHLSVNLNPHQQVYYQEMKRKLPGSRTLVYPKVEELNESNPQNHQCFELRTSAQSGSFLVQGNELGRSWWIAPRENNSSSVKYRLMQAIGYLKDYITEGKALVQIWVPVNRGGKHVLTTDDQPYSLDPSCKSLEYYRNVSKACQFAVDEGSNEYVGLPGRVFLGKLPEWTPDVRFFRIEEYPRVNYAQQYNVCGSLALPVFEQGSGTCLGVVEIVTTNQKINYGSDLESVCKALEAVDLRTSDNCCTPHLKVRNELYHAAFPEIEQIVRSVCKKLNLPVALTWTPCVPEGKREYLQSDGKYAPCLLTVDSACFTTDEKFAGFLDACSEHQLYQGQGIVGKAFEMNKQCFTADVTAFSKSNYPLSHLARMFTLRAAVAIPLRSTTTGLVEFILEFFLPNECQDAEELKQTANSLSIIIQQSCQSLHLTVEQELEEAMLPVGEMGVTSGGSSPSKETSPEQSSWISHMIESQRKGKSVSVAWDYQKEEPKEEFKVTTDWDDTETESHDKQVFAGFGQLEQNTVAKRSGIDSSSLGGRRFVGNRRAGEKRRTKTEKTVSLEVLRQYFAGSLKDAAKSIGVCPTTLKRICRQHGITRWPSRKIKKVGHSLKKLQLMIDSVKGVEGAIQLGSFYTSFPELSSPNISQNAPFSSIKTGEHPKPSNTQSDNSLFNNGGTFSKSPSSSSSQSSGSSTCCSTGAKQNTTTINVLSSGDAQMLQDPVGMPKRARSDAELHALNQEEPKLIVRSQSHKVLGENASLESLPPLPKCHSQNFRGGGTFRVKASFGEEKIRFSLQPNCGLKDLQQEIAKRFNIKDFSKFDIKYLDDDHEWVLLSCDADLEECIDVYKSSQSHTIKISLHAASNLKLRKFIHSTAPS